MNGWGWFAILVNIPISIAVGLFLPKIQRWMDHRGKNAQEKKRSKQLEDYQEVLFYALHSDLLIANMLHQTMWIGLYTLIAVTGMTLSENMNTMLDPVLKDYHLSVHVSLVVGDTISLTLLIIILCSMSGLIISIMRRVHTTHRLYLNVRFFESFVEDIPEELRNKDREQFIINAVWDRMAPGFDQNVKFLSELVEKREKGGSDSAATADTTAQTPDTPT